MLKKDLGICIRTVNYSDTSQILTFFCRDSGKLSAIAKGSKRSKSKFGGAVQLLSFGEMIFSQPPDAQLAGLREFEPSPRFIRLTSSLITMNSALFSAELINYFTEENQPDEEMFGLLCEFLDKLQTASGQAYTLAQLILFQLDLLDVSGCGLILDRCTNCNNSKYLGPFLSSQANGFVCMDCQMSFIDKVRLSKQAIEILVDKDDIEKADLKLLCEIERALIHHFSQLMHKLPRMGNYFLKL